MDYETRNCVIGNQVKCDVWHHGLKYSYCLMCDLQCSEGAFPRTAHVVVNVVELYRRRRADLCNSVAAVWQAVLHLILKILFMFMLLVHIF